MSASQSVCNRLNELEIINYNDTVQAHDMTLEILELEPGEMCTLTALVHIHYIIIVHVILLRINLTKLLGEFCQIFCLVKSFIALWLFSCSNFKIISY